MRRTLRRAAWALVTGASLVGGLPAVAQPFWLPGPDGRPAAALPAPPAPLPQAEHRYQEVAVELAWLADPATFPYALAARVQGNTLELRGYVPTAQVRERALTLARQHSSLPLLDKLQDHAGMPPRLAAAPSRQLEQEALTALRTSFPALADGLAVHCPTPGRMVVTGAVVSPEQQLALGRTLRRVAGCTSVVCQMQATQPTPAVAPVTLAQVAPPVKTARATPLPPPQPVLAPLPKLQKLPPAPAPAYPMVLQTVSAAVNLNSVPLLPVSPESKVVQASAVKTATPHGSYVTSGVVLLSEAETPVVAPRVEAELRQRVQAACGVAAKRVELEFRSARAVVVYLTVANDVEGNRLGALVLALPEFAQYRLEVKVRVAP